MHFLFVKPDLQELGHNDERWNDELMSSEKFSSHSITLGFVNIGNVAIGGKCPPSHLCSRLVPRLPLLGKA